MKKSKIHRLTEKIVEKKHSVYFQGIEPVYKYYARDIKGNTHTYILGLFYPFRKLKKKYYDYKLKKRFKKSDYPLHQCEGCGEGISEWVIDDPNGKPTKMFACQHCVDFYDWKWTKKRLEVQWELDREIGIFKR